MDKPPPRTAHTYRIAHTARPVDYIAPRTVALFVALYCAR